MVPDFKKIREDTGFSIEELAKALNVHESTIYRWEKGETTPRLEQFLKLQNLVVERFEHNNANLLPCFYINHLQEQRCSPLNAE